MEASICTGAETCDLQPPAYPAASEYNEAFFSLSLFFLFLKFYDLASKSPVLILLDGNIIVHFLRYSLIFGPEKS